MIRGAVLRKPSTPLGTPGRLTLETGFSCDTLELPWANNERGQSCTLPAPGGRPETYWGRVWWSPTFRRPVIRYEDKNGRQNCLVHNGNFGAEMRDIDGDGAPEITQIHGCTLVGRGYGDILRKDGRSQWGIKSSSAALTDLINSLRDREVEQPVVELAGYITGYHEVEMLYSWETL